MPHFGLLIFLYFFVAKTFFVLCSFEAPGKSMETGIFNVSFYNNDIIDKKCENVLHISLQNVIQTYVQRCSQWKGAVDNYRRVAF